MKCRCCGKKTETEICPLCYECKWEHDIKTQEYKEDRQAERIANKILVAMK